MTEPIVKGWHEAQRPASIRSGHGEASHRKLTNNAEHLKARAKKKGGGIRNYLFRSKFPYQCAKGAPKRGGCQAAATQTTQN
jgi:hypothetical protein